MATGIANVKIGRDIGTLTVQVAGGATTNFADAVSGYEVFENAELSLEVEDIDLKGVADIWSYHRDLSRDWKITIRADIRGLTSASLWAAAVAGTDLNVAFRPYVGDATLTGVGYLQSITHSVPREKQTREYTILGRGALS